MSLSKPIFSQSSIFTGIFAAELLVKNAVKYLPQLGNRGSYLVQEMNDKLVEHKQYIHEYGIDMPEIRDWKWDM